jgi:hypothetical protein
MRQTLKEDKRHKQIERIGGTHNKIVIFQLKSIRIQLISALVQNIGIAIHP